MDLKKIFRAIKKYIFRDTKYFILYIYRYFQDNYKHNCNFYSENNFVKLLKSGKSLIRIGDGEIGLLHFLPIHYQKYSNSIRKDFLKIIKEYNNDSPYILMIPTFVNKTNKELVDISRFNVWMPLKITYELYFNKKAYYYDQHIFYKNNKFEDLILPIIKTKKIILVTNKKNIEGLKEEEFANQIYSFVETPGVDSYEDRIGIKNRIVKVIEKSGFKKEDFIILMVAGLCKTIIYELSKEGYQLLDIGKGFEAYYKKISIQSEI